MVHLDGIMGITPCTTYVVPPWPWLHGNLTNDSLDSIDLKDDIATDRDILESFPLTFISLPIGLISPSSEDRKELDLLWISSEFSWGVDVVCCKIKNQE